MKRKSSRETKNFEKMRVDFLLQMSVVWCMINLDEIDPRMARSGLFALMTARLEDAHELAVRGQSREINQPDVVKLLDGLVDQTNQIEILLTAIGTMRE